MKDLGKLLAAVFLAAVLGVIVSFEANAQSVKVPFVLVNDIYDMDERDGQGGFARLAAAIKIERAANPNTIVVNAGDLISPSLLSGIDQGEHMIVLSNMIGTEIMVPGNHEFDFGKEIAAKRIAQSKFPWIAANMSEADGTPFAGVMASLVKDVGGVKIAFVGLAEQTTPELSSPGDLKFAPAFETAKAKASELKEAGADFVVAINHNTRDIALKLVDSGAFDLVLNGHNHDLWLFYTGKSAVMESQSDARLIGVAEISFTIEEKDGKRNVSWSPAFRIHKSADLTPDPEVAAKVGEYKALLDKELLVELGSTAIELDSRKATVRGRESNFGNLVADAMKSAVGADFAITNGGGIRGDKLYPVGTKITRRDVFAELPFGNKTLLLSILGKHIKPLLENGVSQIEKSAGRFPQVSGLSFSVDAAKPVGERVFDIMANGKPLDPAAYYKVATNDFMARGGDGYGEFKAGKLLVNAESAKLLANDVMTWIRELGEVKADAAVRITLK